MNIKRTVVTAVAACAAIMPAWAVISESGGGSRQITPIVSTTVPLSADAVSVHAANEAGLVEMCVAGLTDPAAQARYAVTASAHPDLAQQIGPDCSPLIVNP